MRLVAWGQHVGLQRESCGDQKYQFPASALLTFGQVSLGWGVGLALDLGTRSSSPGLCLLGARHLSPLWQPKH